MNFLGSLKFRLSLLVLLFGGALIAFAILRQQQRSTQQQLEDLRDDATAAATRLAGLSQLVLRRGIPNAIDLELSYAAARRDLRIGAVFDHSNNVLHITNSQWNRANLSQSPLAETKEAADDARATMSTKLVEDNDEVIAIAPFLMGPKMSARGVVVLAYEKEGIIAAAARFAFQEGIRFSFFLLGASLLLWLALSFLVTERVAKVVDQTERATMSGEISEPIEGTDEIAVMSRAFATSLRRQQELWQSQQPLWNLVERMQDVFWSVGLSGSRQWYVNPAYEKVWGRPIENLKHHPLDWLKAVAKRDRRRVLETITELKQGHQVQDIRLKLEHGSESRRVLCRSFPVFGEGGEILSIAGLVMDVTESYLVNRRLAEVAEQERRRLGWDLHDDVCQRLVGALFKCNSMTSGLKKEGSSQVERLEQVIEELTDTTQMARMLARGLAPVLQGGGGLEGALEQLSTMLSKTFHIRSESACDPRIPPLQPEAATHLYRIAQELATNAVKHGHATQIEILLWREGDDLELQVRNNGLPYKGLVAAPPSEKGGMGMHMIRQRLETLGAEMRYLAPSVDDQWNTAICQVPLDDVAVEGWREGVPAGQDHA